MHIKLASYIYYKYIVVPIVTCVTTQYHARFEVSVNNKYTIIAIAIATSHWNSYIVELLISQIACSLALATQSYLGYLSQYIFIYTIANNESKASHIVNRVEIRSKVLI